MGMHHQAVRTETLASVAAGAATNDTFYYYVNMQKEGVYYRKTGLQFEWTAGGTGTVTVTLEATMQDDGTAQASCTYQDVTTGLLGAATKTDDFMFSDDDEATACFRYLRVKVVTLTTDGNTAWKLYLKQVG